MTIYGIPIYVNIKARQKLTDDIQPKYIYMNNENLVHLPNYMGLMRVADGDHNAETMAWLSTIANEPCIIDGIGKFDVTFKTWWFCESTPESTGANYKEYVNSKMGTHIGRQLNTEELYLFGFEYDLYNSCHACGIRRYVWFEIMHNNQCSAECVQKKQPYVCKCTKPIPTGTGPDRCYLIEGTNVLEDW